MRILWSSNSPLCQTGYGIQTASAVTHLKKMGHDVALFAFYGLEGSKADWGDIPIYPNDPGDLYGVNAAKMFYDDWKADLLITLVDVWVLGGLDSNMNWVPWLPIDHEPAPPAVVDILKGHPGIIKPIVQSTWGQKQLKKEGIDSWYIPNDFKTSLFAPNEEFRKIGRERYKWENQFVIGTVATNHAERKNWNVMMRAVSVLNKRHPGEIVWYCHTNPQDRRGIDLLRLRRLMGLETMSFFPSRVQVAVGIDLTTMARTYNVFDVFLLATKGEGFCRPIVEAQACGVPVITTKCTSHQEFVWGGWFIEKLHPEWSSLQSADQFDCDMEETVERLEQAYQAKKDGSIAEVQKKAREGALTLDEDKVYPEYWYPALQKLEKMIKEPRNREGVQPYRLMLIPKSCVPRKVLDIGCGITQPYRKHLEGLGDYIGIDLREGEGVTVADAHHLPFRDKEFGFVWMSEILEHLDDPIRAINEAKRVSNHGVCLFSTPENPYFKGDPSHKVVNIPYLTTAGGDGLLTW